MWRHGRHYGRDCAPLRPCCTSLSAGCHLEGDPLLLRGLHVVLTFAGSVARHRKTIEWSVYSFTAAVVCSIRSLGYDVEHACLKAYPSFPSIIILSLATTLWFVA